MGALDSLFSSFGLHINTSGVLGTLTKALGWFVGIVAICIVIGYLVYYFYKKQTYIYPVTLIKLRQDGSYKKIYGLKTDSARLLDLTLFCSISNNDNDGIPFVRERYIFSS